VEKKDLDDSLQYVAALATGAKAVVSFDKHSDGLEMPRAEPAGSHGFYKANSPAKGAGSARGREATSLARNQLPLINGSVE